MKFIILHVPLVKKTRSIENQTVVVNVDKINCLHRKRSFGNEFYTEIFLDNGNHITVTETLEEIDHKIFPR